MYLSKKELLAVFSSKEMNMKEKAIIFTSFSFFSPVGYLSQEDKERRSILHHLCCCFLDDDDRDEEEMDRK